MDYATSFSASTVNCSGRSARIFAPLKTELVHLADWKTRAEAKSAIFEFMEVFYNGERLHSHLGYLSPMEYELKFEEVQKTA